MKYLLCLIAAIHFSGNALSQPVNYKNVWSKAPEHIPNEASTDAPLMGNGDITMSVGQDRNILRYYLSKNDFWRLQSKADHLSGPRVAGYLNISLPELRQPAFKAEQQLFDGTTHCTLAENGDGITATSWVSATQNLIFIELSCSGKPIRVSVSLTAPENSAARLKIGETNGIMHLTRAFSSNVDVETEIDIAVKATGEKGSIFVIHPGKPVVLVLAFESRFKLKAPLDYVVKRVRSIESKARQQLHAAHNRWWQAYWQRSSLMIADTVLMKACYQGLYTMAACSRDGKFPPAIFGWCTTDKPAWNGDYHLNYNFYAPFYALYSANRLQQADVQDAPLLDFMPRGRFYAEKVTHTRGILYPVGIGPLGVEVTRDFPIETDRGYTVDGDSEWGGLFYKQRSNAVFGLVNMAQRWRCTYDPVYGRSIFPYVQAVVEFWEDYLKLENGKYVIYNDAETEKSGFSKNPTMTLALLRNALDLMIDLSSVLKKDLARQGKWQDILKRLSDYPLAGHGHSNFFAGSENDIPGQSNKGVNFSMIYPGNAVTLNSSDRMLKTARTTISVTERWNHHNSTNSFYMAAIRVGYDSLTVLNELHRYALRTYPNGFQFDNPHGIENSCTVINALQEMCCMSVGNRIRLFELWPKDRDADFRDLRTWGAFLTSAHITKGTIGGVKIKSERGRDCEVVNPWRERSVTLVRNGKRAETVRGQLLKFKTAVNELIEIKPLPL